MENVWEEDIESARKESEDENSGGEAREEIKVYHVPGGTIGLDEEENLTGECNPGRSDERIEGNECEIPDEIDDGDDEIDFQKFFLFVVGDEEVGEEGREEIEEEYENDNLHGIERGIEVLGMLDIFAAREQSDDRSGIDEEERGDTDPEDEKDFIGFGDISVEFHIISPLPLGEGLGVRAVFDRFGEEGEHRVEEQCPKHHPHFDDLHRDGIEGDRDIGECARFENREEDDVDLKIDDIEEESDPIGERYPEDMFHVFPVISEPYFFNLIGIKIEESGHDDITQESRYEDPDETPELHLGTRGHNPFWDEDEHDEEHREEIDDLTGSDRDERKLRFEMSLEEGHNRAIHESKEGENSGDEYPHEC